MELIELLEEKENIKKKISEGVGKIKQWFTIKKQQAEDLFSATKDKVTKAVSKNKLDVNKASKLRDALNKLKEICNKIISNCKKALSSIVVFEKIDFEKIAREEEERRKKEEKQQKLAELKEKVMNGMQEAAVIVGSIAAIVVATAKIADTVKNHKED